jgi:hypothetical protein
MKMAGFSLKMKFLPFKAILAVMARLPAFATSNKKLGASGFGRLEKVSIRNKPKQETGACFKRARLSR